MIDQGGQQVEDVGRPLGREDRGRRGCGERSRRTRRGGRTPAAPRRSSCATLQSRVARSVRWRAGTSRARAGRSSTSTSRPASSSTDMTAARAATSSIASGRPSRRRQIRATASALDSSTEKPYRTAAARRANSWTASDSRTADRPASGSGTASGATPTSCSPVSRSATRLVTSSRSRGAAASRSPASVAWSRTDSKLSRISSAFRSSSSAATDASGRSADSCGNRSVAATVATRLGPDGASGTNPTPSANREATRRPASSARRVLPTPPGPVSVTSRGSGWVSNRTSSSSCSPRPTKSLTGAGTVHRAGPASSTPVGSARNRSVSSTARSAASRLSSSSAVRNVL